jgi:hypothetical protein
MQLYYGLLQREVRKKDVWSTLSADEQEAIRENINDVENNRLISYNELTAAASDVLSEN